MKPNKIIGELKNLHLRLVERESSKGKTYGMIVAVVNGKECDLCFNNVYTENALLRAGMKLER